MTCDEWLRLVAFIGLPDETWRDRLRSVLCSPCPIGAL
jgi:hypothetical protein